MTREELEVFHCAVEASIAILGGKYKAIIVWWLTESGIRCSVSSCANLRRTR